MTVIPVGLFGLPGVGKSTTSKLIQRLCEDNEWGIVILKLAEPLYDVQSYIYLLCNHPLPSRYLQDGELLNFLGSHMRQIDPDVLLRYFHTRYKACLMKYTNDNRPTLIVCDDIRSPDAEYLRNLGFLIVRIVAPSDICLARRVIRGDMTLGSDQHPSELGLETIIPDQVVDNSGTLGQLKSNVQDLLKILIEGAEL